MQNSKYCHVCPLVRLFYWVFLKPLGVIFFLSLTLQILCFINNSILYAYVQVLLAVSGRVAVVAAH
jgi:hypothetical protein